MDRRPNIVWVTLESTRADHTTLDGYDRETTPNLQRIAESRTGRSFDECITQGIWTLPSSASILTGTYPSYHGAGMGTKAIPDSLRTVPERLRDRGYATACLSPNSHLSSATGLARGFDRFAWISSGTLTDAVDFRTLVKYALNVRRHGGGFTLDPQKHGPDYFMNDMAKRWLRESGDSERPVFLYAHFGGPHRPYHPPRRFAEAFADSTELSVDDALSLSLDVHDRLFEHVADGCSFSDSEWAALEALYDGEIAHTDELVGDLFDAAQDALDDVVFVITADHGELLGEHGLLAHQIVVDDALCRVPLVVHGSEDLAEADADLVQHGDVMRTLLEAVDAPTDGMQGTDIRDDEREFAVVQRGGDRPRRNIERIREFDASFDGSRYPSGPLSAIRTREHKLLHSEDGTALYDLPDERTDVSAAYPDEAEDLEATLESWLAETGRADPDGTEAEFSDEMREQLADLGYLVD